MRNCNCGSSGSSGSGVRVTAGEGISISGSGTPSDPLVITSLVTDFSGAFLAQDTNTLDLNLVGAGTAVDPFVLSGNATVSMAELSDVSDASGPAFGEVPVYNGTNWEFAAPPTVPPGQVNVGGGLTGDGTLPNPIKVAVSDTTTTATTGLAIYVDSAGKLRGVPGAADWNSIANKPTYFDTDWAHVAQKPSSYPDADKIGGHRLFVQVATPSGSLALDDLWVKKPA